MAEQASQEIPTIQDVRQHWQYDDMTDMEVAERIHQKYAPNESFDRFAKEKVGIDPDEPSPFTPEEMRQRQQNLEEMSSFERGLRGGIEKTKGLLAGGIGAVGAATEETIGLGESVQDWGISEYQEQMHEAQVKYPQKTSFKDLVQDPSLSGASQWASYTIGDLAPTIATTLATGGVGGAASGMARAAGQKALSKMGKEIGESAVQRGIREAGEKLVNRRMAEGMGEKAARKAVEKSIGAQAGMVAGSSTLETGEMYGSAVEELGKEEANPFKALTLGTAAGAVELAGGNIRVLKRLFGTQAEDGVKAAIELAQRESKARPQAMQFLSRMVGEAARQAPAEMGQEASQEAMQIANMQWQDPGVREVLTGENAWQIIEGAAAGGLAGGAMGGVGGTVAEGFGRMRRDEQTAEQKAEEIEGRIERIKENKKVLPQEQQHRADEESQRLERELEDITTQVIEEQEGKVFYDEAADRLGKEAPQPDGKKTTTKSIRKLVKKGKVTGDRFGVDEKSLESHIQDRQVEQIEQIDQNKDSADKAEQLLNIVQDKGEPTKNARKKAEKLIEPLSKESIRAEKRGDTEQYNRLVKLGGSLVNKFGIDQKKLGLDYRKMREEADQEFAQESADRQRAKAEGRQQAPAEKSDIDKITELYSQDYSSDQIAEELEFSQGYVDSVLSPGQQTISEQFDQQIQQEAEDIRKQARTIHQKGDASETALNNHIAQIDQYLASGQLNQGMQQKLTDERQSLIEQLPEEQQWQQAQAPDPFEGAPDETDLAYSLPEEFQQVSSVVDNIVQGKSKDPTSELRHLWENVKDVPGRKKEVSFTPEGFMKSVQDLASARAGYRDDRQEAEARVMESLKQWQTENAADLKLDVSRQDTDAQKAFQEGGELDKIQSGARYAYVASGLDYLQRANDKNGNPVVESFVAPQLGVDKDTAREVMELEKRQIIRDTGMWDSEFNEKLSEDISRWEPSDKKKLTGEITRILDKRAKAYEDLKQTSENPQQEYQEIVSEFDRAAYKSGTSPGNDPKSELERVKSDYVQTNARLKELEKEEKTEKNQEEIVNLRNRLYSLTMDAQDNRYMHPRIRKIQPTRVFPTDEKKQKNQGQRDKGVFKDRVKWASKALAQKMQALKLDFERFDEDPLYHVPPPRSNPIEYSDGSYRMQSVSDDRLPDRQQLEREIAEQMFNRDVFAIDDFQHIVGTPEFMGAVTHQYADQQAVKDNALQPYWTDMIDRAVGRFEEIYERSKNTETQKDQQRILGEFKTTLQPLLENIETKNLVEAISSELLRHENKEIRDAYRGALKDKDSLRGIFARKNFPVDDHIKAAENLAVDFRKHATPTNPGRLNKAEIERRRGLYNEGKIDSIFPKTDAKEFQSGFREWVILDTLRRNPVYNGVKGAPAVSDEVRQNLARGMANMQARSVLTDNLSEEEQQIINNMPMLQPSGTIPVSLAQQAKEKTQSADNAFDNEALEIEERVNSDMATILDSKNQERLAQHPKESDHPDLFNKLYDIASKVFSQSGVHLQTKPQKVKAGRGTLTPKTGIEETQTGGVAHRKYDGDIVSMADKGKGSQKYVVLGFQEDVSKQLTDEDIQRMEELGFEDSVEWNMFGAVPDGSQWMDSLIERQQGYAPTSRIKLKNLSTGKESTISAGTEIYKHPRLDHYFNFRFQENNELRNFYKKALNEYYQYELDQKKASARQNVMFSRAEISDDGNFLRFFPDRRGIYHEDYRIVPDETVQEWAKRDTSQIDQATAAGIERARQLDKMVRAIQEEGKLPADLPTLGVDQLAAFDPQVVDSQLSEEGAVAAGAGAAVEANVFRGRMGMEGATGAQEGKGPLEDVSQDAMSGRTGQDLSKEEQENERFRNIEYLTDQENFNFNEMANELEKLSSEMPQQYKQRFDWMAQEFRNRGQEEGTRTETDQAEKTAHIKEMVKRSGLSDNQQKRIQAVYENQGEQAGNKEAVRATIEEEVGKRYGQETKKKLWEIKKRDEELYKDQLKKAMNEMSKDDPSKPEFHTVEPERFEEALIFAIADKALDSEDKRIINQGLEQTVDRMNKPFDSQERIEALSARVDNAEVVGDLLEDSMPSENRRMELVRQKPTQGEERTGTAVSGPISDEWGDLHGKSSPLHRAVFDAKGENGVTVADRKGLQYKVELPVEDQQYKEGRQKNTDWLTAEELEKLSEDPTRPNKIVGFRTAEERPDADGVFKQYEISIKDEAQLTEDEREAFQNGYHAHITQSAMARAEVSEVKTEHTFQVQIGGKWFTVVPDDTAIKDYHTDNLQQAAKNSHEKAKGKERRPGAQWQTEDWVVEDRHIGYSVSDLAEPRVLKQDVKRGNISKQLNDIAEGFTHGSRNVHVHDSVYSGTVPRSVRRQMEKEGVTGFVKGLYDYKTGTAHVFLNRHADSKGNVDKRSLTQTMLHETVLHGGLTSMFKNNKEFRSFLGQVQKAYKNELPDPKTMTNDQFLRTVEDLLATKVEQTEIDSKTGKLVNPEINTWYDKIASFVVKAARKIANQLGTNIEMTKPEIRETVAKLFKGQKVKTTHGLGHMIPGKFKPAKNVPMYKDFSSYEENQGDFLLRKFEDAYRQWILLKKSQKKQGIELEDYEDPETRLRLYPGKAEEALRPIQENHREVNKLIAKHGLDPEDVTKYVTAMTALERNERIRNDQKIRDRSNLSTSEIEKGASGVYDETANRWLSEVRNQGKENAAHEVAQLVWDTNQKFLDSLVFYGFKNAEEVENMRGAYEHFAPMGPEDDYIEAASQPGAMTGKTDLVEGLRPQESMGTNPVMLTFMRAERAIINGEKNLINQSLENMIYNHPQTQLFDLYLPEDEVQQLQQEMGLSNQDMTEWQMRRGIHSQQDIADTLETDLEKGNLITVARDGKTSYVRINHEGLHRAYQQNGVARGGAIVKGVGSIARWLTMANTMFNPEFMYTNLLRDVGTAVGNTISMQNLGKRKDTNQLAKDLSKTVPSAMRGIYNYNFGDAQHELAGWYDDYVKNGGKIGAPFLGQSDMADLEASMRKEVNKHSSGGLIAALGRNKDKLMDFTLKLNDSFENASRVSAYKVAVENGVSKQQAARMSRELTVDFNRKGELGQLMNNFYIFANAGVGGTARILRGMKDNPQKAGKMIGSIALGGFSMALMGRLMGGTDEDGRWHFEKINRDTRSRHMIFMLPGGDGDHFKIPLPYGFGAFYDWGQLMADYAFGERGTTATAGHMLGAATHNFNPISAAGRLNSAHGWLQMVSPTLGDPIVDISMNKTPFGSPLSPTPEYKGQPDSQRHWDSVGTMSKEVTQWLNEMTGGAPEVPGAVDISPETMDYMLETFGGSAGRFWLQRLPGYISKKLQGKEIENYNSVPGVRRMMGEPFEWQNRQLFNQSVYEVKSAVDRLDNMKKRLRYARNEGARQSAMETIRNYQKENRDLLALDELRKNTFEQIKDIDTHKEQIRKSGYSQTKKDKMLNELDDRQYKIMKRFNSRFLDSVN